MRTSNVQTHTWHGPVIRVLLVFIGVRGGAEGGRAKQGCRLLGEGRHTADGTRDAHALVEWVGLEGLTIVVENPIQVTAHRHHDWDTGMVRMTAA